MNVFISTATQIVWSNLREQLLKQQPACEALNRTALNLTTLRPCIPKENILLIEAVHDLFSKQARLARPVDIPKWCWRPGRRTRGRAASQLIA
jgi:hypothetical protein